jgi:hypothetical protein
MASVVSTLEADYQTGMLSQKVCDLPFSFIAPLGTNNYGSCHRIKSLGVKQGGRIFPASFWGRSLMPVHRGVSFLPVLER